MITCRELIGFLMDYLDGALPDGQRREFEAHLSICPACVRYMDTYEQAVRLGKDALCLPDDEALPGAVPEELVRAVSSSLGRKG